MGTSREIQKKGAMKDTFMKTTSHTTDKLKQQTCACTHKVSPTNKECYIYSECLKNSPKPKSMMKK